MRLGGSVCYIAISVYVIWRGGKMCSFRGTSVSMAIYVYVVYMCRGGTMCSFRGTFV